MAKFGYHKLERGNALYSTHRGKATQGIYLNQPFDDDIVRYVVTESMVGPLGLVLKEKKTFLFRYLTKDGIQEDKIKGVKTLEEAVGKIIKMFSKGKVDDE